MIYLLEYDREIGELISIKSFTEGERALAQENRLAREIDQIGTGKEYEIVLLEAASEEALRKTHSRYFENLKELVTAF